MKHKWTALALALSMLCTLAVPAMAAEAVYPDAVGHYAQSTVETWSGYGVLRGYEDGTFRPNGNITRAEMAAVLDRVMGYQNTVNNTFTDLPSGQWYTDYLLRLAAEGIFRGNPDGTMNPNAPITRQEAFTALARSLALEESEKAPGFTDDKTIADWAKGYVAAMKEAGYIQGDLNGTIRAGEPITRAEVVTVLNKMAKAFVNTDGTYSKDCKGNLIINAQDVTLKNMTIDGDLIVADGVADGDVYLDKVTVKGSVILRGCGENSFHVLSGSKVSDIIIHKTSSGDIRVVSEKGVVLPNVRVSGGRDKVILQGNLTQVNVECDVPVVVRQAQVNTLSVSAAAEVDVESTSTVSTLETKAAATVSNSGKITTAKVLASGLVLDGKKPTTVTTAKGVAAPVNAAGTKVVTYSSSSSGSSSSNGSSSDDSSSDSSTPCSHVWGEYTYTYIDCQNRTGVRSCTLCGAQDSSLYAETIYDSGWHVWVTNNDGVAPTCTATGLEPTRTCTRCGKTNLQLSVIPNAQQTVIPATGHSFGAWVVTTPATDSTAGSKTRTCSVCGHVETESIPAGTTGGPTVDPSVTPCNHSWTTNNDGVDATCVATGLEPTKTCSICGINSLMDGAAAGATQAVTPLADHSFGEWTLTTEPTASSAGLMTRFCRTCGASDTQSILSTSNASESCSHQWTPYSYTYGSDCQSRTPSRFCTICGMKDPEISYQVIHDDAWHAWGAPNNDGVAATCTTDGLAPTRTCTRCGKNSLQASTVPNPQQAVIPAGHTYGAWTVTTPITVGGDAGVMTRTCSECGNVETRTFATTTVTTPSN